MALDATTKEALNTWATVIESVGDDVARYAVYTGCRTTGLDDGLAEDYLRRVDNEAELVELHAAVRKAYVDKKSSVIDPITTYDIINGLFWPTVGGSDAAMVDHPTNEELTSMRGVAYHWVFPSGKLIDIDQFTEKLIPRWDGTKYEYNSFESDRFGNSSNFGDYGIDVNKNPVARAYIALRKALLLLKDVPSNKANNKEALSLLFKSEHAAKLYWIYFCRKATLGYPINTLRYYNPYFAYFNWKLGWDSGDKSLQIHGVKTAVQAVFGRDYYEKGQGEDLLGDKFLSDRPEPALAQAVNITNAAVQAQYKWIQAQKTKPTTKEYYEEWFKRFFKNPKSLVNMIIIVNEMVNIDRKKQFTHTIQCREKLTKLGVAYQSALAINIGN